MRPSSIGRVCLFSNVWSNSTRQSNLNPLSSSPICSCCCCSLFLIRFSPFLFLLSSWTEKSKMLWNTSHVAVPIHKFDVNRSVGCYRHSSAMLANRQPGSCKVKSQVFFWLGWWWDAATLFISLPLSLYITCVSIDLSIYFWAPMASSYIKCCWCSSSRATFDSPIYTDGTFITSWCR